MTDRVALVRAQGTGSRLGAGIAPKQIVGGEKAHLRLGECRALGLLRRQAIGDRPGGIAAVDALTHRVDQLTLLAQPFLARSRINRIQVIQVTAHHGTADLERRIRAQGVVVLGEALGDARTHQILNG